MVSSNDTFVSDMIVKEAGNRIKPNSTIKEIAALFSEECIKEKRKHQEREILGPMNLSYSEFLERSKDLPPDFVRTITNLLFDWDYELKTDFLILGIDAEPHIYTVDQDGESKLHDLLGFAVIGSGYSLAFPELTKFPYEKGSISWQMAMIRVYAAKKAAERMGGVGRLTNLAVLHMVEDEKTKAKTPSTWVPRPSEIYVVLDKGIKKLVDNEIQTLNEVNKELEDQLAKMKEETDSESRADSTSESEGSDQ
jgi:hypothetical protein